MTLPSWRRARRRPNPRVDQELLLNVRRPLSITLLTAVLLFGHSGCRTSDPKRAADVELHQVHATIVSVEPSLESGLYVTVTFRISNPGHAAQTLSAYDISWPGGFQRVAGLSVRVDANSNVVRTVRVQPSAGILTNLTADAARIVVR